MISKLNVVIVFFSFIHNSYGRRRVLSSDNIHSEEIRDSEYNILHDLTFSQSTTLSTKDSTKTTVDNDTYLDPPLSTQRRLDSKLYSSTASTQSKTTTTLNPEDHRVINLPGLDTESAGTMKQYAGHLPVDMNNEGFLFYWLFEAAHEPENGMMMTSYHFESIITHLFILS